jgi:thiol-disulfide isomerase/thioredoxin
MVVIERSPHSNNESSHYYAHNRPKYHPFYFPLQILAMRKLLFYYLLAALCPLSATASPQKIIPLRIGDSLPDILLTNVQNHPSSIIRLSNPDDKLTILDFWSTFCGSCLDAMPHMQTLQAQFGDRIKIILVNAYPGDDMPKVNRVFDKIEQRKGFKVTLPFVIGQLELAEYFPHRFVPHYVWLKNGKVAAITNREAVTAANITRILSGKFLQSKMKADNMGFNRNSPLQSDDDTEGIPNYITRSLLTKHKDGIGGGEGMGRDSSGAYYRYYYLNTTGLTLLQKFLPSLNVTGWNQLSVDNNVFNRLGEHVLTDTFCYELITRPQTRELLRQEAAQDLSRLFPVQINTVKMVRQCLVLQSSKKNTLKSFEYDDGGFSRQQAVLFLNRHPAMSDLPVIDDDPQGSSIPVKLAEKVSTREEFLSLLKKAGIAVSIEAREIEITNIALNP